MPPATRRSLAVFDNVSSCVRRSVWEHIPFEKTRFGEDLRWGKAAVEAGHKLVYEPHSAVLHSHERGALYDLKRHYVDALILQELFGLTPTPNLPRLLLNVTLTCAHLYRSKDDTDGDSPPVPPARPQIRPLLPDRRLPRNTQTPEKNRLQNRQVLTREASNPAHEPPSIRTAHNVSV